MIGLPSPPPARKASKVRRRSSGGLATVSRPSAQGATQPAVSGVIAAPKRAGGRRRPRIEFASSTRIRPRWVTVSPAQRARITSTHSLSRALRVALSGQGAPVMCSFRNWPLPTASQNRPGYISASVAAACARTAGW